MSRQIVITLPEWTEIKQIDNKQFADLLPAYDEMLNMIKNGTPLDKIRAEIDQKQYDFMSDGDYDEGIRFGLMLAYQIIDKYREESEG